MFKLLQLFQKRNGHSLVTIRDNAMYPGLYQWTLSIRRNYRYQVFSSNTTSSGYSNRNPNSDDESNNNFKNSISNDTTTTTSASSSSSSSGSSKRPRLSNHKLKQLIDCNFPWDVQDIVWKRRYQELQQFYFEHGHCNVPLNYGSNDNNKNNKNNTKTTNRIPEGLGIWVQNQRSEYKKYRLAMSRAGRKSHSVVSAEGKRSEISSRLSFERVQLLERLNFQGFRSHDETWNGRYQQLKQFYERNNHTNVPTVQVFSNPYAALGMWCNNQRTAYRSYRANGSGSMNHERIWKLEAIEFQWHYRKSKWFNRLERLKEYYSQYGHTNIPTDDEENRDLRLWLIIQRYHYNNIQTNRYNTTKSPLTESRIKAIEEAIPNFRWKVRGAGGNGPSSQDWANLFDAMREKGIQPGMKPKQHWFQGTNPFAMAPVKDRYTEQDLLELWYQEEDDDDDCVENNDNFSNKNGMINDKDSSKRNFQNIRSNTTINYYVNEESTNRLPAGWSVKAYIEPDLNGSISNSHKGKKGSRNQAKLSQTKAATTPLALESLLSGNAEQIVRQRQTYSDILKDDDDFDPDSDLILLGKHRR